MRNSIPDILIDTYIIHRFPSRARPYLDTLLSRFNSDLSHLHQINGDPSISIARPCSSVMATTLYCKVTTCFHYCFEYRGNIICGLWFDATCWHQVVLLGIPKGKRGPAKEDLGWK